MPAIVSITGGGWQAWCEAHREVSAKGTRRQAQEWADKHNEKNQENLEEPQ